MSTHVGGIVSIVLAFAAARGGHAAQGGTVEAQSRVSAVTVMPDRAVVTRRFEAELAQGRAVMIIDNLLPGLDERTLKCLPVPGTTGVVVVDVSTEVYARPVPAHAGLASLVQEMARATRGIRACQDEIVSLRERGRVLGEYRNLTTQAMKLGLDTAPSPAVWKKALEFISAQAADATAKIRAAERRTFELAEKEKEIGAKIASIKAAPRRNVRRVRVAVDCALPGRKEFDLSYLVTGNVKWGPRYDLRLDRGAGKVEMSSRASVTQETGEDWPEALLTFSTQPPAKGLRPPEVKPVFLDAVERLERRASVSVTEVEEDESLAQEPTAPAAAESLEYVGAAAGPPGVGAAPKAVPNAADIVAEIRSGGEAVEFVASARTTVRTDGHPVTVAIGRWEAVCNWSYEAVPKIRASVYVRAAFVNPTDALMLPGEGECWLDGAYVGRMEVPPTPSGAEVNMSFGAAEHLSVSRTAEPLASERRGVSGRGRVYHYDYTIELGNRGDADATVAVLDNVPVSTIEAIAVDIEPETTPHEELDGGRLRWLVALPPGEHTSIRLRYRIEIARHYRY